MKIQSILGLVLSAVVLTACGGHHEEVAAVDKLAEAQAIAKEKAPQVEEIKFDDEGQPSMVQLAADAAPASATATDTASETAPATTDAPATAEAVQATETAQ
ncbi:hypothetical protein LU293_02700 [Moraxella nasovis]|uniref:hypothetical protein n=1 Tax=Moraxella nasovis TaxID=2904121 RepID=UPI001F617D30|nr:hypothetical protein [Moraxella nasovis]UNU73827.1 hypothetical protein LU293_02700 [Moraxella nasovis]